MLVSSDSIYQVSSDSMSIVRCHILGVRYQVSSNNMSVSCELNIELQHHMSINYPVMQHDTGKQYS